MVYRVIRSDAICDGTLSLRHYGILGMKWGVRRTPEQLGHHRIKKGTTVYRVTSDPNEKHSGYAYVSYLPPDRDRYRSWQLSDSRQKYEKSYALTKDLKVPSRAELTDVIYQSIKTDLNKKFLKEVSEVNFDKIYLSGDNWMYFFDQHTIDKILHEQNKSDASNKEGLKIIKRYAGDKLKPRIDSFMKEIAEESPEKLMVDVMMALEGADHTRSAIFDELKRRGYNAVVDENDVGGILSWSKRSGVEPLIVFDRQDVLSEKNTALISEKTAKRADKRYKRWQNVAESHRKNNQW